MHKRKIKKVLIIAMVMTLAMVSGCKEKGKDTNNINKEIDIEKAEGQDDESKYDIEDINCIYPPTKEIKSAKLEDEKIQIKDKVYTLPMKYTDLAKIEGFKRTDLKYNPGKVMEEANENDKISEIKGFHIYEDYHNAYGSANIDGVDISFMMTSGVRPYKENDYRLKNAVIYEMLIYNVDDAVTVDDNFIYIFNGIGLADSEEEIANKTINAKDDDMYCNSGDSHVVKNSCYCNYNGAKVTDKLDTASATIHVRDNITYSIDLRLESKEYRELREERELSREDLEEYAEKMSHWDF